MSERHEASEDAPADGPGDAFHAHHHAGDPDTEWFEEWFRSDFYMKLYSHRDAEEAEACVDLILGSTGIAAAPRSQPVAALDLACGPGRHAMVLAERGCRVTAVDLSPTLLAYAESQARREGLPIRFLRSDMREIDFDREFDLVLQLFTSFGYFDEHSDDARVLGRVRASLRGGGYYALDLINEQHLRRALVPTSFKSLDGLEVREDRRIADGRVEKRITIPRAGGGTREFIESVQLYSPETIEGMLYDAGLSPVHWFGDYDGAPYDPERSERMLVVSVAD